MSSSVIPFFVFLIGLNFISPLFAKPTMGTAFLFGEKLENIPSTAFNDMESLGSDVWFAGDGLYRLSGDNWETIRDNERFTALVSLPGSDEIWVAGSGFLNRLGRNGKHLARVDVEVGFIWTLAFHDGKVWYFGSEGFGWIDPVAGVVGQHWVEVFSPRPFVIDTGRGVYVGSYEGLWKIESSGPVQALPLSATRNPVNWMERDGDSFLLGTNKDVFRWSGLIGESPDQLNSNYGQFFIKGINNSVGLDSVIAIADYPSGVALMNRQTGMIQDYVSSDETLGIGDLIMVRNTPEGEILLLGIECVASVDSGSRSRFFPSSELWSWEVLRHFVATAEGGFLFSDGKWVHLTEEGYETGERLLTNWVDVDPDGNVVCGALNAYDRFIGHDWETDDLGIPINDFKWGFSEAFAFGDQGIYILRDDQSPELVHRDDRLLALIGETETGFYALVDDKRVLRLTNDSQEWRIEELSQTFDGSIIDHGVGPAGISLATQTSLYRLFEDRAQAFPVATGWDLVSLAVSGTETFTLYHNANARTLAVGMSREEGQVMLSVPYIDSLGEPVGIIANDDRLGVIGSQRVGWYAITDLGRLAAPRVEFAMLLDDKRIEDRMIPSGMHFIELQVKFAAPEVPSIVQYRINEDRWRTVSLQDPSLQFAGHGNFTVELRAMHPNGNVSASKMVQFGIAPPWYLNPLYQGVMLVLALLGFWGLFALRSAQLKRTNYWLQGEVKKQTRELEAATAARTNFLAGLSHDIRNPLNGVLMITETLTRNPPTSGDDPRLKDLTEFGVIVDRMLGEILDFSAIDQQNIPTAYIPVSVHDIVESTVKQNQFGIQNEMVTLNTMMSPELREVVIRTDRNWMIKIMSNLLINSLQYSESDRVEVGAKCINLTESEVDLELYVADWGIGIDESEREFIFERFYRGESGVESGKHGTGLGLSICQEIAHAMGGHLRLEDNDPSGCRFVLKGRFDRVEGAKELDKEAVLAQLKGKRILVVDDLVYNRRSVVEFFETIGCSCDEAENGREAMDLLTANDYYLALLDWDLPGLTGPEISRRHRKKSPDDDVILVAVTAYTDGEKKRESEEAGMNGYISKPLTAARLAYCLANIQNWKPELDESPDAVAPDEVMEEIYKHVEECLLYGERYEWENLRRCAHRLTTLALIRNNRAMQQVCRDLQVSAENGEIDEIHVGLLELQKWRRR